MPNWVTNRLILTGPADEIARFASLCIRPQVGEEHEEIRFDFTALIPAPPEIEALLSRPVTAEQKTAARAATGFDDWYPWRMSQWGTKWNAAHHHVIVHTDDRYDFSFDTAWSCPKPIFRALAQAFPAFTGFVFAVEGGNEWACAGFLTAGTFRSIDLELSRELQFIVHEAPQDPDLADTTSRSIAAAADDLCGSPSQPLSGIAHRPESFLQHVWASFCGAMPAGFASRFQLHHDIGGFLEWQEGVADGYWTEDDHAEFTGLVTNASNQAFLTSGDRFGTELDGRLMAMLARYLILGGIGAKSSSEAEWKWNALAGSLAGACDEDALLNWAPRAILRNKVHIDMHGHEALQHSFVAYAHKVLADVEAHLAGQAASAPTFQGCGRNRDLVNWDTDESDFDKYWAITGSLLPQLNEALVAAKARAAGQLSITPQATPNIPR
jgi:hypothetical protein